MNHQMNQHLYLIRIMWSQFMLIIFAAVGVGIYFGLCDEECRDAGSSGGSSGGYSGGYSGYRQRPTG